MCGFCSMLGGQRHWSDAGTNSDQPRAYDNSRAQRLERLQRIKQLNFVITTLGFHVSDWANKQFIVKSHSGRTEIVDNLPHLWSTIESISLNKVDPLDIGFIKKIEALQTPNNIN
ncbi:MAG: hypothetical protein CMD67_05455 [Gammaproteobacteria bacterium]|nr:hypothetical protein [Gammaproteobacteria bacterium]